MDDGCVTLIVALVVIGLVIALIVYIILPLTLFLLGGLLAVGTISGAGVAGKNFYELLIEAHKNEP